MDFQTIMVVNNLADKIATEKPFVSCGGFNVVNEGGGFFTCFNVYLPSKDKSGGASQLYAYKNGSGFFCDYSLFFEGLKLEVPNNIARRVFKTMEQLFKAQERVKSQEKIAKLADIVVTNWEPVGPALPAEQQ